MAGLLQRIDDDLWVCARPHRFFGLHLGTRMTVVRLPSGALWIHSPVEITRELRSELDALGEVRHLVAPNLYHHVYLPGFVRAYPEARVHGADGLDAKRKDVRFDRTLGSEPDPDWGDVLEPCRIRGSILQETCFFHRPSRSLITADLVENFESCSHWPTRAYLKVAGLADGPGFSRLLRPTVRDRAAMQHSLETILKWPLQRMVICHGEIVNDEPAEALRRSYAWL